MPHLTYQRLEQINSFAELVGASDCPDLLLAKEYLRDLLVGRARLLEMYVGAVKPIKPEWHRHKQELDFLNNLKGRGR
jgi:hypothetical protein